MNSIAEMAAHRARIEQYRKDQKIADRSKARAYIEAARAIRAGECTEYQLEKEGFTRPTLRRYTSMVPDVEIAATARKVRADELSSEDIGHLVTFRVTGIDITMTGTLDTIPRTWGNQRQLKIIGTDGRIYVEKITADAMVEVL